MVHELLIVLLDEDGLVTTVNEIAAAHALDMSVGHASVRDQFVRHLFTDSCVIKESSGGGGRVCPAIHRRFQTTEDRSFATVERLCVNSTFVTTQMISSRLTNGTANFVEARSSSWKPPCTATYKKTLTE